MSYKVTLAGGDDMAQIKVSIAFFTVVLIRFPAVLSKKNYGTKVDEYAGL